MTEELRKSLDYIKNTMTDIRNRLNTMEEAQLLLIKDFGDFKENKKNAEQFFINGIIQTKKNVDNLEKRVNDYHSIDNVTEH